VLEEYAVYVRKEEMQVTYLTLLQEIKFAAPDSGMNFNTFRVLRLSDTELGATLDNRGNQIFYPWATADVERLRDYWFLMTTRSQSLSNL
jgi:hypothetical protein